MAKFGAGHIVAAAVAGVVGLVIGGLGPRSEVRTLEKEVTRLETQDCERPARTAEIANILRGRPWEDARSTPEPAPAGSPPAPSDGAPEVVEVGDEEVPAGPPDEETVEAILQGMELRRRQARAALIEDAWPDDGQVQTIDAAYSDMNTDLQGIVDDFLAQSEQREPSRRDLMVFAADTLDTFIAAEDRVADSLSTEQLDAVDPEAIDPLAHIDPALVEQVLSIDPESILPPEPQ